MAKDFNAIPEEELSKLFRLLLVESSKICVQEEDFDEILLK